MHPSPSLDKATTISYLSPPTEMLPPHPISNPLTTHKFKQSLSYTCYHNTRFLNSYNQFPLPLSGKLKVHTTYDAVTHDQQLPTLPAPGSLSLSAPTQLH